MNILFRILIFPLFISLLCLTLVLTSTLGCRLGVKTRLKINHWRLSPEPPELAGFYVDSVFSPGPSASRSLSLSKIRLKINHWRLSPEPPELAVFYVAAYQEVLYLYVMALALTVGTTVGSSIPPNEPRKCPTYYRQKAPENRYSDS